MKKQLIILIAIQLFINTSSCFSLNQKTITTLDSSIASLIEEKKYIVERNLILSDVMIITNNFERYSLTFIDLNDNSAFVYNNRRMPAASTIKLFIMAEVFRNNDLGKIDIYMDKIGDKTIYKLVYDMIVYSDNSATNLLIKQFGLKNIDNQIILEGFYDTNLERLMLDEKSKKKGFDNITSTFDLSNFMLQIYNNNYLGTKSDREMIEVLLKQSKNNKIPKYLPSDVQIAHKTGSVDSVENDVGIVYTKFGNYIISIMSSGDTNNMEIENLAKMSKYFYDFYINKYNHN